MPKKRSKNHPPDCRSFGCNHYFHSVKNPSFNIDSPIFYVLHDCYCNNQKHEIDSINVLIEPSCSYEGSIDSLATTIKFKMKPQTFSNSIKNLGIANWTDDKSSSYGTYLIDDDKYLRPFPIVIDHDIKYLEIYLTKHSNDIESISFDLTSPCRLQIATQKVRGVSQ